MSENEIREGWVGRVDHDPRGYYSGSYIVVCRWLDNAWYIFSSATPDFDRSMVFNDVCMDEDMTIEEHFRGVEITWLARAPQEICRSVDAT